jgi:hypothetical protein
MADKGYKAAPGDVAEESLQVFFLLNSELCRIDGGINFHAKDPQKATGRVRMRAVFVRSAGLSNYRDRQANASQNESQQISAIRHGRKPHLQKE